MRKYCFVLTSMVAACQAEAPPSGPPSWEAFAASVARETAPPYAYLVDIHTPLDNLKQLREFYDLHVAGPGDDTSLVRLGGVKNDFALGKTDASTSVSEAALVGKTARGVLLQQPDTRKHRLTYCISTAFGAAHASVRDALAKAASEGWSSFSDVRFSHVAAADARCDDVSVVTNDEVYFRVVKEAMGPAALAFFPNAEPERRKLVIAPFTVADPNLDMVLAHELGHIMGFRHEHVRIDLCTRNSEGKLTESPSWQALTIYDPVSIMHYPHCRNERDQDLMNLPFSYSLLDRDGARSVYGAPSNQPFVAVPGLAKSQTWPGITLRAGEFRQLGAIVVANRSQISVRMTGTGDPDLYVRFGSAPSLQAYNCRPFQQGATERCEGIQVPDGVTTVHIGVGAASAARADFHVAFVAP